MVPSKDGSWESLPDFQTYWNVHAIRYTRVYFTAWSSTSRLCPFRPFPNVRRFCTPGAASNFPCEPRKAEKAPSKSSSSSSDLPIDLSTTAFKFYHSLNTSKYFLGLCWAHTLICWIVAHWVWYGNIHMGHAKGSESSSDMFLLAMAKRGRDEAEAIWMQWILDCRMLSGVCNLQLKITDMFVFRPPSQIRNRSNLHRFQGS